MIKILKISLLFAILFGFLFCGKNEENNNELLMYVLYFVKDSQEKGIEDIGDIEIPPIEIPPIEIPPIEIPPIEIPPIEPNASISLAVSTIRD